MATALVTLVSMDGKEMIVPRGVAMMSSTIKSTLEEIADSDTLPLPNVSAVSLEKIIAYCTYHFHNPHEHTVEWDAEFCKMDIASLFDITLAANYLDIKPLLDLTCKTVAVMIRGKTPAEICQVFGLILENFTPEEEARVLRENEWCERK